MSRESMDVVQAAIDAYFRGDESAMLDRAAPDIIVTQFPDQPDVQDYHGHEGLLQVMAEWTGTWDDWSVEILRTREIGDRVLVGARQRGRGKGSGAPVEGDQCYSVISTLRDGRVVLEEFFLDHEQALKAAGLEDG